MSPEHQNKQQNETTKHPEYECGQRVATLTTRNEPAGSIGTVVNATPLSFGLDYVFVEYDGDTGWSGKPTKRAKIGHITPIGCSSCNQTGIVAERREGTLYPTACPDCFSDGKQNGYYWDAEEYHLRHSE